MAGFGPSCFLATGWSVAFFAMTATVAAAALWRTRARILRLPAGPITGYLGVILLLCKSLASLVYGTVLVSMVRFAKPQLQMRLAMVFAVIVFSYPLLRTADLVPTEMMLDAARSVDMIVLIP